jgi:hypothetical protein
VLFREEHRKGLAARNRHSGNDYAGENDHPLRPINRIPHSKPPPDVLYEYREKFQAPVNLKGFLRHTHLAEDELRHVKYEDEPMVKGKRVTGFTNDEANL